jgi:transcriptional regulator with XRE-family HTH domain
VRITPEILRFFRLYRGMTTREFAEKIGCSCSLISKVELARNPITMRLDSKIREAFDLTDEKIKRLLQTKDELNER